MNTLYNMLILLLVETLLWPTLVRSLCLITIDEVDIKIQKGFHRKMRFSVTTDIQAPQSGHIILDYPVSTDIYIDKDEIFNMANLNDIVFNFSSHIDTELPSYRASNHSVALNVPLYQPIVTVEFPFHLRYQRPSTAYYRYISIPVPTFRAPNTLNCTISPLLCDPLTISVPCGVIYHAPFVIIVTICMSSFAAIGLSVYFIYL